MRVIVKKITILLQSIRVAKTAKQKGSLYPPVFCSHVRGQTDLPSPFLFFSFSVLFSWIMDETRYLHIFPCSCRMLGHDQIGQGTTQHKVASRTTRLRQLGIASSKIRGLQRVSNSFRARISCFMPTCSQEDYSFIQSNLIKFLSSIRLYNFIRLAV